MVAPRNIVDSYRHLPAETREAIGAYWRNQITQHAGTPWEDLSRAWALMIEGDEAAADVALRRVIDSSDAKAVAQARTAMALLHEGKEGAADDYAKAAAEPSATFAMYKQAETLRRENKLEEAEALLRGALDHIDDGDIVGLQFIASEYVLALLALGRLDEAIAVVRELIEKYPNDLALRRKLQELEK